MPDNSFPALALYDPNLYVQQQAIERKQALAQALLGAQPAQGAYGGLAAAGRNILGAALFNRSNRDLANLYNPQTMGTGGSDNMSQQQIPQQPNMAQSQTDAEGTPVSSYQPPQAAPQGQPIQQMPNRPPDYGSLPPQLQRLYDSIPHVGGLSARESVNLFLTAPQQYSQAVLTSAQPSEQMKNAQFAYGGNTPAAQQAVLGYMQKQGAQQIRPGGGLVDFTTGNVMTMPNQQGIQTTYPQGMNGPAQVSMAPGASEALTQASAAQGMGRAATTPAVGYSGNQPVATNQANMLGYGQPNLNINANNPLNMQPGGQEARYSTPTAGFGTAWDNLTSYGKSGINTVGRIVHQWAPNAPPQYAASVAQKLGVSPEQPLNLSDPNVKGALIDAMRPNETGNRYQNPQGPMLPELPQGQPQYMQEQGRDAAARHDQTVAAAAESPMRINVLDNIINLSRSGVATGPGQEWQNAVLGYAANAPGLSKLMAGAKDNVAKFQELQKFTYQNALRNWQAAGGTGTDKQMESMSTANPNDHLFPAALSAIANWAKASELAIQGKANAQDAWLGQRGQTPQNQIAFENAWRNAFDPKVFQYQLMAPQEKQAFARDTLKTPEAAKAFLQRQQALKGMGAIQ